MHEQVGSRDLVSTVPAESLCGWRERQISVTTLSKAARVESPASMRRLPASSVKPCPFSISPTPEGVPE